MIQAAKMNREDRLERTMSMAHNKGLLNLPGENNCFLNSAVQVLWHLDVFRRSFREIKGHFCLGRSCIFCALKWIFEEFQYGSDTALPPDALRIALAQTFKDQMRFQMGDMDDAAECFENILARIHFHISMNENSDGCSAKHCISHQKFAMQIIEQTICECGEMSEPLPFFQLVHYVSASALCSYSRSLTDKYGSDSDVDMFGKLLRSAGEDIRECPAKECQNKVRVQRLLLNSPDIVSVGLIWDSDSPEIEHISELLQCIGTTLTLQDLYHHVYDKKARYTTLRLVGIVTYYGKHYSTFFFHNRQRTWIYFDDARVKEIGPDWSEIIRKCRRCHYQPLLLLYANPQGTPVDTQTAPTKVELVNGATPYRMELKRKPDPISEESFAESSEAMSSSTVRVSHTQEAQTIHLLTLQPIKTEVSSLHEIQGSSPLKPSGMSPITKKSRSRDLLNTQTEKQFSKSNLHRTRSNETLDRYPDENSVGLKRCHSTDLLTNSKTSVRLSSHELLNGNARDSGMKASNSRGLLEIPSSRDIRGHSSDLLDSPTSDRFSSRASSVGSDSTSTGGKSADECHSPGKESLKKDKPRKKSLKKIGSALKQAINPISFSKKSKEKEKYRRNSEGANEKDLINLSVQVDPAKEAIMALYEQSKAHHLNRFPSTCNDSGIGSTPSSATSSVSSTDTTHGGSNEDLVNFSRSSSVYPRSKNNSAKDLLRKGDGCLQNCQRFQKQQNYESALCLCTEANSFFRVVAEMQDATPDEALYAQRRRSESLEMARVLRQELNTQTEQISQTEQNSTSFSQESEEELLQKQQRRDQRILQKYQQVVPVQTHSSQVLADQRSGHSTLPRKMPSTTVRTVAPSRGVIKEKMPSMQPEQRLRPTEIHHTSNEASQFGILSKAKVYNVRPHYSKSNPSVTMINREGNRVCSQKIKPDEWCYSPVHYDRSRDNELASRMESTSLHSSVQNTPLFSAGEDRSSTSAPSTSQRQNSSHSTQVPTTAFYITAPKQSVTSRPSVAEPTNNRQYTDNNYFSRRPPAQKYQVDKRGSYYDNVYDSEEGSSTSHGQRLPSYREPPSYHNHQMRDVNQKLRDSNQQGRDTNQQLRDTYKIISYPRGAVVPNMSRPWSSSRSDQYSGYPRGNSDDIRQISAQINSGRQKCASCHGVLVERGQSYCAACQVTIPFSNDRENARLY